MHSCQILLLLLAFLPIFGQIIEANEDNYNKEHPDEIVENLPGVNFPLNFKHYNGFLKVTPTHFLHYWFVTSQGDPAKDPLIFWFNGGPGCSSIDGLLTELGPYLVNEDGKSLRQNPYAWNKHASIVFLESPVGVGFSYATDAMDGNYTMNDDKTAQENYEAIKQFFGRHPSYRNHDVFITGESYAGIYVPMVTALVLDGQRRFPINLKGMAIGNGYVNAPLDIDTTARFAYYHGLVDEHDWNTMIRVCCDGCADRCNLAAVDGFCKEFVQKINVFVWHAGLNPYDLYRDCDPNGRHDSVKMEVMSRGILPKEMMNLRKLYKPKEKKPVGATHHKLLCMDDGDMTSYMNLPQTRKALKIPANMTNWYVCSNEVSKGYQIQYTDTSPFMKRILCANVRILLYYGDTDMACNFLLGQQFSARLGLKVTTEKEPWHLDGQIGGFKTIYGDGLLTFLTVRGAGHMVPTWRPSQAEHILKQFLNDE